MGTHASAFGGQKSESGPQERALKAWEPCHGRGRRKYLQLLMFPRVCVCVCVCVCVRARARGHVNTMTKELEEGIGSPGTGLGNVVH